MRWLADECVAAPLVAELRRGGHDVVYVAELAPAESDQAVVARAQTEDRLLLTEDKDFGELIFRQGASVPGLILLRLDNERSPSKWARLEVAINHFAGEFRGRYTVIEKTRFRSRSLRANE